MRCTTSMKRFGVAVAAREKHSISFSITSGTRRARRTGDHLPERGAPAGTDFTLVAADLDLVPLLPFLRRENADMADVVVAAGVHASEY